MSRIVALLMLLMLGSLALDARAQPQQPTQPAQLPSRRANYAWDKTLLRASFRYTDLFQPQTLTDKLSSGLPTVIAMRAYVFKEGDTTPVALTLRTCRVAYDLWEEVYRVKLTGQNLDRDTAVLKVDGVLRLCTEVQDLEVVDRSLLTVGAAYFLAVIAEVNPPSPEMVAQMRAWVARPTGSTGIGPGDALFGSFVRLFVPSTTTKADKTLVFRTQTFTP